MTAGTAAEPAGESTVERRNALGLAALFGGGWLALTGAAMLLNPLLPLIRQDFQLSGTQAGLLTTAFSLPYLLMQVPSGLLADRFGPKRVLVVMLLVAALGLGGIGLLATSLAALVVFAVVHRLGAGFYYSSAFGITMSSLPRSLRGVGSAILSGGMALGTAIGTAIAVPLALLGGSWRFPYAVMAVATLLVPLAILKLVRSGQRVSATQAGGIGPALRDRRLWLLFAMCLCNNFAVSTVITWGPSFLHAERGLPLALAGLYLALFSVVGFPAGFLAGRVSDRVGRRSLTIALFAASALSVVAFTGLTEPILIVAAVVGYGLTGKWATDGPLIAWLGDHVTAHYPGAAASLFGVSNMLRMVGMLIAPLVVGALLDLTGSFQPGLYVGAGSLVLAAVLALLAREPER